MVAQISHIHQADGTASNLILAELQAVLMDWVRLSRHSCLDSSVMSVWDNSAGVFQLCILQPGATMEWVRSNLDLFQNGPELKFNGHLILKSS